MSTSFANSALGWTSPSSKLGNWRPRRTGTRIPARYLREFRLERAAWLVAAAPGADADERHPVGSRDRAADDLGVEAEEGAGANRHLLAVDPPDAGARDHDVDLLLARVGLVMLDALGAGRQLEPVDPECFEPELAADEADAAGRARALDLVHVDDRVAHQALIVRSKQPSTVGQPLS